MNKLYWAIAVAMLLAMVGCNGTANTPAVLPTIEQGAAPTAISQTDTTGECTSIAVLYHERLPYMFTEGEGVKGLTGTPVTFAFEKAGIPYQWSLTPSKRAVLIIQENTGCDCGLGWFKNPEREKFAKFTLPIYQDKPQIAIARADNENLKDGMTLEELLTNRSLVLGVKDGYSYGKVLDEKIAQYTPTKDITTAENVNMLAKVHEKRNDYFFMAPEEADGLIASSGLPKDAFKYVHLTNMPEGEKRYLMCSQNVSNSLIEKINTALQEIVK